MNVSRYSVYDHFCLCIGLFTSVVTAMQEVVVLDYNDLIADVDLSEQIESAFGFDGLGLLTVKNVPQLELFRSTLLPLAHSFSQLPQDVKDKYIHEESSYSFGWSHGKEKLEGKPDHSKGSFYANPQYDRPVDDDALVSQYPAFIHPNIWPTDDLPALEPAFKDLGRLIVSVGLLVAKQCDRFVKSKAPTYTDGKLHRIIDKSLCCKARLLHYFPLEAGTISDAGSTTSTRYFAAKLLSDDYDANCVSFDAF